MRTTIRVTYDSFHILDRWTYQSGLNELSLINLLSKNFAKEKISIQLYKQNSWEICNKKTGHVERFATREEAEKRIEELLPPISIIKTTDDLIAIDINNLLLDEDKIKK